MAVKTGIDRAIKKMEDKAAEDRVERSETAQSLLPLPELLFDQGKIVRKYAGRKKGAINESTRKMVDMLRKMNRIDPLDALSVIISRPISVMAAEMNCSLIEAAKFQKSAMDSALPFWHAKRAPENSNGEAMPEFAIYAGVPGQGTQRDYLDFSDPKLIEASAENIVDNQSLSEDDQ